MLQVLLLASSYLQPLGRPLITRSAVTQQRSAQFLMQDGDGISAIQPEAYRRRFQQKITQIIDHQGFVREV